MIPTESDGAAHLSLLYDGSGYDIPEKQLRAAIAAALNAWPGVEKRPKGSLWAIVSAAHIVLPLQQKGGTNE
jgi:hypothetical protein